MVYTRNCVVICGKSMAESTQVVGQNLMDPIERLPPFRWHFYFLQHKCGALQAAIFHRTVYTVHSSHTDTRYCSQGKIQMPLHIKICVSVISNPFCSALSFLELQLNARTICAASGLHTLHVVCNLKLCIVTIF